MAVYRISGIWKSDNNVITHYAVHKEYETTMSRAEKTSKAEATALLETRGNRASTIIWNYGKAMWSIGENVEVVNGRNGKYLRSNPDNQLTDNLQHLIDFDWISR